MNDTTPEIPEFVPDLDAGSGDPVLASDVRILTGLGLSPRTIRGIIKSGLPPAPRPTQAEREAVREQRRAERADRKKPAKGKR
jgi:hypothetical protein